MTGKSLNGDDQERDDREQQIGGAVHPVRFDWVGRSG
jgi:hypothetical protein